MKNFYIKDIIANKDITLKCWIADKRQLKNNLFLDLYDSSGEIEAIANNKDTDNYNELCKINRESCIEINGIAKLYNNKIEILIHSYQILSSSTLNISPYPNAKKFDILSPKSSRRLLSHPTFYIRNRLLSKIFYIKSVFKREMQNYFWDRNFVEFEAPTLTRQTLYEDKGVVWVDDKKKIGLSRCATFHLEPALLSFEKLFTITNSHSNEKVKTNRHLIEYLHLKAEMAFVTLDELMEFAKKMYYEVAVATYKKCENLINEIVGKDVIAEKLDRLNPVNHKIITYDEAVKILKQYNIDFEYGKSLTTKQEQVLTRHFDENFLWVKYIPYTVEGFMFKRCDFNSFLTMTADLIAPCGFGEILGCAEKVVDYEQIISNMKDKNKLVDFERYKDFALLHQFGMPDHGGIGMGIERAVKYLLNLSHVKYIKPFPVVKIEQINH